jgi:glutamate synthase (NADPH/NADH) small chain
MVIEAIGQKTPANLGNILPGIKLNRSGLVETIENSRTTSRPDVFAGGDIINGGATAVQAVADGLRAAEEIHEFVMKK